MLKFLLRSKYAAFLAQAAVIIGALDLASVAQVVPAKVAAVLVFIGGLAAAVNNAAGTETPARAKAHGE